jgi:SAM-dependent methyltransferase
MEQRAEDRTKPQRVVPAPPGLARGAPAPWWVKLGAKLGLAAIGLHGDRARRLRLARPSFGMDDPASVLAARDWVAIARTALGRPPRGFLEIGPGGMTLRAPLLAGLGLGPIWFADAEDNGPQDPAPFRAAATLARAEGIAAPSLDACTDRASVLARCDARLLLGGPAALAVIPDGSIDLVVSTAALEHVRRDLLMPLLAELRRVSAPDAVGLHGIDFQDHLGGGLQHLRFSDAFWASALVDRAGVYVNRLGLSAMVARFQRAGFAVEVPEAVVWEARPPGPVRPHPEAMRPAADDLVARALLLVRPLPPG